MDFRLNLDLKCTSEISEELDLDLNFDKIVTLDCLHVRTELLDPDLDLESEKLDLDLDLNLDSEQILDLDLHLKKKPDIFSFFQFF